MKEVKVRLKLLLSLLPVLFYQLSLLMISSNHLLRLKLQDRLVPWILINLELGKFFMGLVMGIETHVGQGVLHYFLRVTTLLSM
jgi:hypothetical protein